jgi:tRNA pseudouridine38-40 synthase
MPLTRWKLTLEYDGQNFCGWQLQDGVPTVQGAVEDAIKKFCGQDIRLHVAGRTDAGVHARGQVAHMDLDYGDRALSGYDLCRAINAHLKPHPVSVLSAQEKTEEFHARFSAKHKLYTYRILLRSAPPTLDRGRVWSLHRALDIDAMNRAAQALIGEHDFTTFRATECQAKSPIKNLTRLETVSAPYDGEGGLEINIHAEGRSFLHHQVRNMVGTLVLVGEGKWTPDDVRAALHARNRAAGGPTAPPDGLYLIRIDY